MYNFALVSKLCFSVALFWFPKCDWSKLIKMIFQTAIVKGMLLPFYLFKYFKYSIKIFRAVLKKLYSFHNFSNKNKKILKHQKEVWFDDTSLCQISFIHRCAWAHKQLTYGQTKLFSVKTIFLGPQWPIMDFLTFQTFYWTIAIFSLCYAM